MSNVAASGDIGTNPAIAAGRPDLVGVGGWLLFFCVSLTILRPLGALIGIAATFAQMPSAAIFNRYPGLGTAFGVETIAALGLTGFSVYAGYCLWSIKANAVSVAKAFLITSLAYALVSPFILIPLAGLPGEANAPMIAEGVKAAVLTLIGFAIWFNYLNKSLRVKGTYPPEGTRSRSLALDEVAPPTA